MSDLGHVLKSLADGFEEDSRIKYHEKIQSFLSAHPTGSLTPEQFSVFVEFEHSQYRDLLIQELFPEAKENWRYKAAISRWDDIYNIVGNMVEKKHGSIMFCKDVGRWIANQYLKYLLTKRLPDLSIDDENTYWKPDFGTAQQWMDLCEGIMLLRFGNPRSFVSAYLAIMNYGG